jgi:hypothetical protein
MATEKTKPFDYAQDVTKQLLTLSTAIVTITVAFIKDIAKGAPDDARIALYVAWGLFALAIIAGVATLLNLTGRVGHADAADNEGIRAAGVRMFAVAQILFFVAAICATIYFGARSFDPSPATCTITTTKTSPVPNGATETVSTADC